ncbi:MAG: pyridoxal phosphate-dependent aminotransferase [Vicinamibacteria bacterium]
MREAASEYMEWAKTRSAAPFNLASSGVAPFPLADLGARFEDLELCGDSGYGYVPLLERLARRAGVDIDRVVHATGTSMANLLVLAAAASPGDQVLIEEPTYPLLVDAARWLRLDVRRFVRRADEGFRLDPHEVEKALTPRTRLIALTNLHNPSSALTPPEDMRAVGDAARSIGARVFVDEVYLESLAIVDRPAASAASIGPEFVVTSSLTKVYGLSGLRCGWVIADPDLVHRMLRLNDLFGVIPAHAAERLSVVALDHLDRMSARSRRILEANTARANAFLAARGDLACRPIDGGMTAFPRLLSGSVDTLCDRLRAGYDTTVVPGRFFSPDVAGHFRLALGCAPETLTGGLDRLGRALDEANRS